jgi:nucleoside-diphosphate-sugar epimerase
VSGRLLVIGGSYFVGRGIAAGLIDAGHEVSLLNRGSRRVPGTRQLTADRNDAAALTAAAGSSDFDWVIDCCCYNAAQARLAYTALAPRSFGWIHLSSAAVHVDDAPVPTPEQGYLGPSQQWAAYGRDKLAAERELERVALGSPVVAIRAPYVYGPGENPDREPWLWARMLQRRPVLIPEAGSTPIQFLHTSDLAGAVAAIMSDWKQPGFRAFHVAEARAYPIRDYVRMLAAAAGVEVDERSVPYSALSITPRSFFPFRDTPCVLDVSAIRDQIGWHAARDLRTGLAETFASHARSELEHAQLDTAAEDQILERMTALR